MQSLWKSLLAIALSALLLGGLSTSSAYALGKGPKAPEFRLSLAAPVVIATKHRGVESVAGLKPGPDYLGKAIMPADMVRRFGRPRLVRRPYRETCLVRWPGIEASFTTYGLQGPCRDRPLHALTVTGRDWSVAIGRREYAIGDHRRSLPRRAHWRPHFGFELAWMPFIGRRTATVGAQVGGRNRIRAFNIFIGAAGD